MLAKRHDTLYILTDESKESWQFSSKEFKLVKLKRTRPQDMPDLSPKGFEDARARIDFGNFTFKNDTLTGNVSTLPAKRLPYL